MSLFLMLVYVLITVIMVFIMLIRMMIIRLTFTPIISIVLVYAELLTGAFFFALGVS